MGWSLSIGRIFGTTIRVHVTFLLFLVWIFAAVYAGGGPAAAWNELAFVLLLFFCVLLHEFGHIFAARAFRVSTPDVTLLPIGGIARLEHIPEIPYQEFLIAIAGPVVNVVIALVLMFVGLSHVQLNIAMLENGAVTLVDRLALFNLLIAAFNVIPAFPMDGGRVLRAALAANFGFERATTIAAGIGQWVAFVLGFVGLFFNPMLIFIAIFVYLAASAEAQSVALRGASHGVPVSAAMMTEFATLHEDASLEEAADTLLRTSQSEFPVVDEAGKLVGILGRNGLIEGLKREGWQARVSQTMTRGVPVISSRRFLDEAFRLLEENAAPAVGVADAKGKLVGLVTRETVGEMLMLRRSAPRGRSFKQASNKRSKSGPQSLADGSGESKDRPRPG